MSHNPYCLIISVPTLQDGSNALASIPVLVLLQGLYSIWGVCSDWISAKALGSKELRGTIGKATTGEKLRNQARWYHRYYILDTHYLWWNVPSETIACNILMVANSSLSWILLDCLFLWLQSYTMITSLLRVTYHSMSNLDGHGTQFASSFAIFGGS